MGKPKGLLKLPHRAASRQLRATPSLLKSASLPNPAALFKNASQIRQLYLREPPNFCGNTQDCLQNPAALLKSASKHKNVLLYRLNLCAVYSLKPNHSGNRNLLYPCSIPDCTRRSLFLYTADSNTLETCSVRAMLITNKGISEASSPCTWCTDTPLAASITINCLSPLKRLGLKHDLACHLR